MFWILITLIILTVIEISVFIWIGGMLGVFPVILLILSTGILGIAFVRFQGFEAWRKLQMSLANGEPPGDNILSIICVIIGGVLLLIPGFVTDVVGFFLVLPWTRKPFKALILYFIMKKMAKGKFMYRRF